MPVWEQDRFFESVSSITLLRVINNQLYGLTTLTTPSYLYLLTRSQKTEFSGHEHTAIRNLQDIGRAPNNTLLTLIDNSICHLQTASATPVVTHRQTIQLPFLRPIEPPFWTCHHLNDVPSGGVILARCTSCPAKDTLGEAQIAYLSPVTGKTMLLASFNHGNVIDLASTSTSLLALLLDEEHTTHLFYCEDYSTAGNNCL